MAVEINYPSNLEIVPSYDNYKIRLESDISNTTGFNSFKYYVEVYDDSNELINNIYVVPDKNGLGTFDGAPFTRYQYNNPLYIDMFTSSTELDVDTSYHKEYNFVCRESYIKEIPFNSVYVSPTTPGGVNSTVVFYTDKLNSPYGNYNAFSVGSSEISLNINSDIQSLNGVELSITGASAYDTTTDQLQTTIYTNAFLEQFFGNYGNGLTFSNVKGDLISENGERFIQFNNSQDATLQTTFINSVTDELQNDFNIEKYDTDLTSPSIVYPLPFLSDIKNDYQFDIDDKYFPIVFNFNNFSIGTGLTHSLIINSDNGEFEYEAKEDSSPINPTFKQLGVGPWNLRNIDQSEWTVNSGAFPIIDSDTTSYTIKRKDRSSSSNKFSQTFKFNINNTCSRYQKIQLLYQDRLGSYIPFTFKMMNKINKKVKRETYRKINTDALNHFDSSLNDTKYKRGLTNINLMSDEVYQVTSDWVNQATSDTLNLLFESTNVYWLKDNELYAINILDNRYESKKTINDQLINYTITFKLANKSSSQY